MKIFLSFVEIILLASFTWFILGRCTVEINIDKKRKKISIAECTISTCKESDRDIGEFNCLMIYLLLIKAPPKDQTITPEERASIEKQNREIWILYKLCNDEAQKKDKAPKD